MADLSTEEKLKQLRKVAKDADEEVLLDILTACNGSVDLAKQLLAGEEDKQSKKKECPGYQSTLKRFITDAAGNSANLKKPKTDQKGTVVHLYDENQIRDLLPCTFHRNIFPKDLADSLLEYLLEDSKTWRQRAFTMFEREVASHHTACLYSDPKKLDDNKTATYNGVVLRDVRIFNDLMTRARDIIEDVVNTEVDKRGRTEYQPPSRWTSDTALCNRYENGRESVGYHSDQMTNIGPHAIIASISLGATREFRLKHRHDRDSTTFSVHLPHNSLIIMHATCQELYKHSIVPVTYPLAPHSISGTTRLNITYRWYRREFRTEVVPKCDCGIPMILRTTIARGDDKKDFKYIWQCGGELSGMKGCGKVTYPKFTQYHHRNTFA
ncbi:hypothetical protein TRVA0_007S02212 [Trichomonascus vanleenenianus]|uniref:uncharacterized protein n=1 Tax=Trichomonascus vanleenenianus TaxID=2268995 RepID=UPI003ECB1D9A